MRLSALRRKTQKYSAAFPSLQDKAINRSGTALYTPPEVIFMPPEADFLIRRKKLVQIYTERYPAYKGA